MSVKQSNPNNVINTAIEFMREIANELFQRGDTVGRMSFYADGTVTVEQGGIIVKDEEKLPDQ